MKSKVYHIFDCCRITSPNIGTNGLSAILCGYNGLRGNSLDIGIVRYEPEEAAKYRLCKRCLQVIKRKEIYRKLAHGEICYDQ